MTLPFLPPDLADSARALRTAERPFAVACVVRAEGASAAGPGDRALVLADGTLAAGFLGGGCTTSAVGRAAQAALADGQARLLALRPPAALAALGVAAGTVCDGVTYARNGCPSGASLDIFVEPVLPAPELVVCGGGPVALALLRAAAGLGVARHWAAAGAEATPGLAERASGLSDWARETAAARHVVVATQGRGDAEALRCALSAPAAYVGLVASRRKAAALLDRLAGEGVDPARLAAIRSPAGLDIGARSPEEIALSVLAEIVALRRGATGGGR